jgi:hypothetical protein
LLILHLAVDFDYCFHGGKAASVLAFQLIDQVKQAARKIKGIKCVRLIYGRKSGRIIDLPVKKNSVPPDQRI